MQVLLADRETDSLPPFVHALPVHLHEEFFRTARQVDIEDLDLAQVFDEIDRSREHRIGLSGVRDADIFRAHADTDCLALGKATGFCIDLDDCPPASARRAVPSPSASTCPLRMFMAGEPMNWATNRLPGRR